MFTYCLNNPVNLEDEIGVCANTFSIYLKADCGRTDCPTSESFIPYTVAVGGSLSATLGCFTYGIQVALVTDAYGDSEVQLTFLGGLDPSTISTDEMYEQLNKESKDRKGFSISAMLNISYYNAPRVTNLHGMSYQAGGTLICGGAAAVDYNFIPPDLTGTAYHGVTVSGGYAMGTSGGHGAMSSTFYAIPVDVSVFDVAEACYNAVYGD